MTLIKPNKVSDETPLDRIYKAFISHGLDKLSDTDKGIYKRITEIDKQISARKPIKKTVRGQEVEYRVPFSYKELCEWVVERFKVSHRQAYIDIDMSKRFYLSCETKEDQEVGRGQRIAIGNEFMFEAFAMGDYKAGAALFTEINKVMGLHTIKPETFNPEHLIPAEFLIVDDPSQLDAKFPKYDDLPELIKELERDFKKKAVKNVMDEATDIDYESEEEAE